jgi:hypothetical protein
MCLAGALLRGAMEFAALEVAMGICTAFDFHDGIA